ncbi:MAG TPA: hypothetical protein VE242_11225, partial [Chthoniobacterales bacterium]|nr:hypothetical protein [Chthoniobacterales bacterium]
MNIGNQSAQIFGGQLAPGRHGRPCNSIPQHAAQSFIGKGGSSQVCRFRQETRGSFAIASSGGSMTRSTIRSEELSAAAYF